MPTEKLRRFNPTPEFVRKVNALFRLDENQRIHYDMKRGFRHDRDCRLRRLSDRPAADEMGRRAHS
jgi:hypothetical protein